MWDSYYVHWVCVWGSLSGYSYSKKLNTSYIILKTRLRHMEWQQHGARLVSNHTGDRCVNSIGDRVWVVIVQRWSQRRREWILTLTRLNTDGNLSVSKDIEAKVLLQIHPHSLCVTANVGDVLNLIKIRRKGTVVRDTLFVTRVTNIVTVLIFGCCVCICALY